MERWAGKVAVVTGASAGIGLETAKALVRHGMIVIGLARRVEKMQKDMSSVKGPGKFYPEACDVESESDIIRVFGLIEKKFKTVNVLVNNAGVLKDGKIQDLPTEDLLRTMNVNVMGLLHCTRQALKMMKKNNLEGHIVNINSNAGHRVPHFTEFNLNIYPASKHAVTAISEALINELNGGKIRVTSISPGVVKTEIFDAGQVDSSFLQKRPALDPEDVANSIVHVISARPHVQITELTIKPLGQCH